MAAGLDFLHEELARRFVSERREAVVTLRAALQAGSNWDRAELIREAQQIIARAAAALGSLPEPCSGGGDDGAGAVGRVRPLAETATAMAAVLELAVDTKSFESALAALRRVSGETRVDVDGVAYRFAFPRRLLNWKTNSSALRSFADFAEFYGDEAEVRWRARS